MGAPRLVKVGRRSLTSRGAEESRMMPSMDASQRK
jgi:hypothetical protein